MNKSAEAKTRVVLCEDQRLFRHLLGHYVLAHPSFLIVGEESDGRKALDLCLEQEPDLVLLDLGLPNMHGLDVLRQLKKRLPETKVVVITMNDDKEAFLKAHSLGVDGYLEKDAPIELVCQAMHEVVGGQPFYSEQFMRHVDDPLQLDRPARKELTGREVEILCLLAAGKTREEMADELGLSILTIQKYFTQIRDKTAAENDVELVSYAERNGLIPGSPGPGEKPQDET